MSEGLHGVAVYNPSLSSDAELRQSFVARITVLDRIVEEIKKEKNGAAPQHHLILGLRGMGKTTLLRRVAIAVQDDPLLNAEWLPLTFPEEQYNVATPRDFWFNCLDSLCDILEKTGNKREADHLDDLIEKRKTDHCTGDAILRILIDTAHRIQKRLVLLVDNIDFIFDRLKEHHWSIREILQSESRLLVIGASHRAMEATYTYEAAFYDFFRIHELKKLTREETYDILKNLAQFERSTQVARLIETEPARINALHTLTGGNPRTIVLLFKVLSRGLEGDVRSDLEGLLDMVTPLYKARFEELPSLSQQVVGAIALHWDPIMARGIASELNMQINKVSAQLSRLLDNGIIEEVPHPKRKRASYQISERFFNIWYLMRASRRVKRK
ncbi:MAG: ATP-binding protein, partial [Magnetococcales bacterium]|nr:ATP-binding protein [Magnetococcales bacterium]